MGQEKVTVTDFDVVENVDANWPSGDFLQEVLVKFNLSYNDPLQSEPHYWQISARWALMRKFGFPEFPAGEHPYEKGSDGRYKLPLTEEFATAIQARWESLARQQDHDNDLLEFLHTSKSNGRQLRWSVMNCAPGCQFKLHAHPNIELVYCIKGALHGIRMQGEPLTKTFEKIDDDKVKGPNLHDTDNPWFFETLPEGQWLVNEVGSIHKSFTATSGEGCIILVLWGGSHADIAEDEVPQKINVQEALDHMDNQLSKCNCTDWEKISETFLPESEKSQKKE